MDELWSRGWTQIDVQLRSDDHIPLDGVSVYQRPFFPLTTWTEMNIWTYWYHFVEGFLEWTTFKFRHRQILNFDSQAYCVIMALRDELVFGMDHYFNTFLHSPRQRLHCAKRCPDFSLLLPMTLLGTLPFWGLWLSKLLFTGNAWLHFRYWPSF